MHNRLILILAQDASSIRTEERFEFARWSAGNELLVGGLLTAALLYLIVWLYRRETRGRMGRGMRWTLVAVRCAILLALGVIGLEPVMTTYLERRIDACTLVLVDSSASMSLADHYRRPEDAERTARVVGDLPAEGVPRSDVCARLATSGDRPLLAELARRNGVRLFDFSTGLSPRGEIPRAGDAPAGASSGGAPAPIRFSADGPATDLAQAVRAALDAVAESPVAGIVLLSDGVFNSGEPASVVGRLLRRKGIPLFAVGVGDPAEPVNLRVVQVSGPRASFKNDPFGISVRVEAQGLPEGEAVKVELLRRGGERPSPERVATTTLRPAAGGILPPVEFEQKVDTPGEFVYIARVSPLAAESVLTDNEKETLPPVRVLDDRMRVLLVAGSPSYDYRFLTRMLERDATVDLSTWLQSADQNAVRDGDVVITELPAAPEQINTYDAIVLMDVDPQELDPTWASLVANYVGDHGGGVLVAAGNKYTGRFLRSPKVQPLLEILPVVPDPEAEIVINELGHYQTQAWPILVPDEAAGDAILQQGGSPDDTRAIWAALGGVHWHYPVRREKPVARALMRHANPRMVNPQFGPHVLLATQYVGAGRTAWLGINSTWRWRRHDEKYFNRFWIQMLRFLVEGKLLGGRARGQILTQRDQFDRGDVVVVTVRALDESFNPLLLPAVDLAISSAAGPAEGGSVISLAPVPGREGYYEGRFAANEVGTLRLSVELPGAQPTGPDDAARRIERDIVVSQPDIEMRNIAMDRAALRELAEAAGGRSRYFDVDEALQIPPLIEDMSRTSRAAGRSRALWDNAAVLSLLVGLLTVEWILRRVARLL